MQLVDYFTLLMARIQAFQAKPADTPDALSDAIGQLIDQAHTRALKDGVPPDTFRQALYPILAWADEAISRANHWDDEHAWQRFLLQRRYFRTGLAGREFFDRLDQLDPQSNDLREIYLLCLCLGFQGRYSTASNTADLADIRMKQYRLLPPSHDTGHVNRDRLFPEAYPERSSAAQGALRRRFSLQRVLLILVPPLIILLLAIAMHTQLTQAVLQFREAVNL